MSGSGIGTRAGKGASAGGGEGWPQGRCCSPSLPAAAVCSHANAPSLSQAKTSVPVTPGVHSAPPVDVMDLGFASVMVTPVVVVGTSYWVGPGDDAQAGWVRSKVTTARANSTHTKRRVQGVDLAGSEPWSMASSIRLQATARARIRSGKLGAEQTLPGKACLVPPPRPPPPWAACRPLRVPPAAAPSRPRRAASLFGAPPLPPCPCRCPPAKTPLRPPLGLQAPLKCPLLPPARTPWSPKGPRHPMPQGVLTYVSKQQICMRACNQQHSLVQAPLPLQPPMEQAVYLSLLVKAEHWPVAGSQVLGPISHSLAVGQTTPTQRSAAARGTAGAADGRRMCAQAAKQCLQSAE